MVFAINVKCISVKKDVFYLLLKIGGTIAIIFILFYYARIDWDFNQFKTVFAQLNIPWFLMSLSGVIILLALKSIRWNLLLRAEGCNYPYWSSFSAYMASLTIGLITPGRVGEIARLYYVRGDTNIDFFRSFKTIVTDRIFDFAILFWFGAAGLLFFYKLAGDLNAALYLVIAGIPMLLIWGIVFLILKRLKSKKTMIVFVSEAWNEMFQPKMFIPWLLTILAYLVSFAANWLIFKAVGESISIIEIGFVLSLMSLVTLIPITLAGFGTREASLVYMLAFYGIAPETAIVFSLLQFLAFFFWSGLIGLVFWIIKPVKLSLIKDDAKKLIGYMRPKNAV